MPSPPQPAPDRKTQAHRLYDQKRWHILRRKYLYEHPLCEKCGKLATQVDHVIPLDQGGQPFDKRNLSALCGSCHSIKTRAEQMASRQGLCASHHSHITAKEYGFNVRG